MEAWNEFSGPWPSSGSMRSGVCFQRPKSARRISGNDCSSWPSPRGEDSESCGNHPNQRDSLSAEARNWPTANTRDSTSAARHATETDVMHPGTSLTDAIRTWATPNAHDGRRPGPEDDSTQGRNLKREAEFWQTPSVGDTTGGHTSRSKDRIAEPLLNRQAQQWPTPQARDHRSGEASQETAEKNARPLNEAALRWWPTPAAERDGNTPESHLARKPGRTVVTNLDVMAECLSGPQLQTTAPHGPPPSNERRTLNPRFVEWLMGFPIGWTDCAPSETESFRTWRRARGKS